MDDKYIKGETLGVGTFASVIKATVKEVSRCPSQNYIPIIASL